MMCTFPALSLRQAVILAGGRGTRLKPLTDTLPKPMVHLNGRPFLEYLIELLRTQGVTEVVLLLGYLSEKIMEHFGDGSGFGLGIRYSVGAVEESTGTRLRNAKPFLQERFLLLYGDNYCPISIPALAAFHERRGLPVTMTVYDNPYGITKNNVHVDDQGSVLRYDKSRTAPGLNGVEIGFFVMNRSALADLPDEDFSFEEVMLPRWVAAQQLAGFRTPHRYYSIGSLERLPATEEFLRFKKAVLLDRDGVINVKPPRGEYVRNWSEFRFIPGAVAALRRLTEAGYAISIISNQAGIARGYLTIDALADIHRRMRDVLTENGVQLAGIYYCPHGWDDGCSCRKPKPGMLFAAAAAQHLDLTKAIFVGDDERDQMAGEAAGCRALLVSGAKNLSDITETILTL